MEAKGGNSSGDHSLAGAGGGGRIALITNGSLSVGELNSTGGSNMSIISSIYRQQDLVGYWKLDEAAHSSTADNFNGDSSLDGNISGSPERRAGLFGGAFLFRRRG